MFGLSFDKNQKIEEREFSASNFIPYLCHCDENTIITKNGDLLSVIKVNGFSFETADDDLLELKKDGRNNIFKGMADSSFQLYFHTIRKKHSAYADGVFDDFFPKALNEEWKIRHNPRHIFINQHYITIVRRSNKMMSQMQGILDKINGKNEDSDQNFKSMLNELSEARDRIVNGMMGYGAKLMGIKEIDGSYFCQIMEFLGYIINGGLDQRVIVPRNSIDSHLQAARPYFGDDVMEFVGLGHRKFGSIVSLKEYRPVTFAGMLDNFLQLPFEFVMTQSFSFTDRMSAINKMKLQQRRMIQAEDVAISQVSEINNALDAAMGGIFAFGDHHLTIMPLTENEKDLDGAVSQCIIEFANIGVIAVKEGNNMEAAFWSQLPGNIGYAVRKSTINTLNLAGYASFHNYPSGKAKNNHWGNAVTVFNTTSGTPFFFNFHSRDIGHTMIVGPTGAGKTVLLSFLCAQAQKFKPRMFVFDKDRGCEIFLRSIKASHMNIDPGIPCGFNPLQIANTAENKNFLLEWIKLLVTTNGEKLTAEEIAKISMAVEGNFKIPQEERILRNIAPFLGLEVPGSIASRLKMWYSTGSKANVFDNPVDKVDFTSANTFGFEMASILKDKDALGPVLFYLFHRINESLDGTPTMIVLDEAWALIDNPIFAPRIKDWLKVLRKLNAFVVFATQSVEDASKSQLSDTLVQQTATQIYLPNLRATSVYQDVFMLSQREFALVKNTDPATRFFLIKQDTNAVIAKLDMAGMDDYIHILSGRAETVRILDKVIERVGNEPVKWIPAFLNEVDKIQK